VTVSKDQTAKYAQEIISQVRRVVVGKDQTLLWVLATVLAGGHILLEDLPGMGKTTMALAFSKVLGLQCNRMQFTPDVLPSDVTGYSVLEPGTGKMVYRPGAVLCNLFLADELNRATSRTQSALLEAMEEGQVTVDGISHPIPQPFTVIATQNPTGAAGTQRLPDSQLDRFMVRLSLGYPGIRDEIAMVLNRQKSDPLEHLKPLMNPQQMMALRQLVSDTYIKDEVVKYIVELCAATRKHPDILQGASPRATLSVAAMSKAIAQLQGRDYVIPEDVHSVFVGTVAHRIFLTPGAIGRGETCEALLEQILSSVKAPRLS
jgi:MoxR-like ATPase